MMPGDYVVILHGIFRSARHMQKLAHHLQSAEYDVLNLDYPSTRQPLEMLVETVWQNLQPRLLEVKPVHFVGYSMGGLLVRAILSRYRPEKMGRVVLLAPPNQGSEIADFLKKNWLYQRLYGPAGQQLGTDQQAIQHLFGPIDYACGVLAGNRSIDPICSWLIRGVNDGKVSVERTKIEGMCAHLVIPENHTFFPSNRQVHAEVAHFLAHGFFRG